MTKTHYVGFPCNSKLAGIKLPTSSDWNKITCRRCRKYRPAGNVYFALVQINVRKQVEFYASPDDDLTAIAKRVATDRYDGDVLNVERIELVCEDGTVETV